MTDERTADAVGVAGWRRRSRGRHLARWDPLGEDSAWDWAEITDGPRASALLAGQHEHGGGSGGDALPQAYGC